MLMNNADLSYKNGDSATVSVADWLLLDAIGFLNLVPVVGTVAALVLYMLIAANRDSSPSVQSRIIASLIWLGAWVVVLLLFDVLVMAGVLQMGWMPDVLSGLFPSNS